MTALAKARADEERALEALRAAVRRGDPDAVLFAEAERRARKARVETEVTARRRAALEGARRERGDRELVRAPARSADRG